MKRSRKHKKQDGAQVSTPPVRPPAPEPEAVPEPEPGPRARPRDARGRFVRRSAP
jgi:hypothetical protein